VGVQHPRPPDVSHSPLPSPFAIRSAGGPAFASLSTAAQLARTCAAPPRGASPECARVSEFAPRCSHVGGRRKATVRLEVRLDQPPPPTHGAARSSPAPAARCTARRLSHRADEGGQERGRESPARAAAHVRRRAAVTRFLAWFDRESEAASSTRDRRRAALETLSARPGCQGLRFPPSRPPSPTARLCTTGLTRESQSRHRAGGSCFLIDSARPKKKRERNHDVTRTAWSCDSDPRDRGASRACSRPIALARRSFPRARPARSSTRLRASSCGRASSTSTQHGIAWASISPCTRPRAHLQSSPPRSTRHEPVRATSRVYYKKRDMGSASRTGPGGGSAPRRSPSRKTAQRVRDAHARALLRRLSWRRFSPAEEKPPGFDSITPRPRNPIALVDSRPRTWLSAAARPSGRS